MKFISSRDNPAFKALKKLCIDRRERQKQQCIVLDGWHLIEVYTQKFGVPIEIFINENSLERKELSDYLLDNSLRIICLAKALFNEISSLETPSGILAVVNHIAPTNFEHGVDSVVLDGVQDPGNLGSILRSAAAAGFQQVLLSADCAQAWSPKTLRAGVGAHFQIAIYENINLPEFFKNFSGQTIVTDLTAARSIYSLNLRSPVAWVFGHEGQGVRAETSAACQTKTFIPMLGAVESLNVGAAAAICLFETVRQRQ